MQSLHMLNQSSNLISNLCLAKVDDGEWRCVADLQLENESISRRRLQAEAVRVSTTMVSLVLSLHHDST